MILNSKKEEILSLFTGELTNTNFHKPFNQGDYVFGCDGISMVVFSTFPNSFNCETKPDCTKFLSAKGDREILLNIQDLKTKMYTNIPSVDEIELNEVECEECDGDGGENCDKNHFHSCGNCEGEGILYKETPTGRKILHPDFHINIDGALFNTKYILKVAKACEIYGATEITKVSGGALEPNVFIAGEVTFILMPVTQSNNIVNI